MKKTGWAILLALCCIGGYLVLPSNYYLRRALIHLLPKIDQYPIFENRTIEAGAPQAWIQSEDYNKLSIPENTCRYLMNWERSLLSLSKTVLYFSNNTGKIIPLNRTVTRFPWPKALFR